MTETSAPVMLNLFQQPLLRSHRRLVDAQWTLKRVQGDEVRVAK